MGMTNWKRMYTYASIMLDKYQNEVVPKLREQLANRVEVVHGRWVEFNTFMTCSECDTDWYYTDNDTDRFNYCPNCGARMRDGDGNG